MPTITPEGYEEHGGILRKPLLLGISGNPVNFNFFLPKSKIFVSVKNSETPPGFGAPLPTTSLEDHQHLLLLV
jgi:hypothetical protein